MTTEITRAEFYEKYGEIEVKFSSYYKYTFYYEGVLPDGRSITVGYGGNSAEIYRREVFANTVKTINVLQPYTGAVYDGGKEVEHFYDY